MRTGHQNSHKYQFCKAPFTRPTVKNLDGTKGTRCAPLLPHCRSWGSGRWMCTCTANSGHNPPTIQRYIPINVQQNDSNSSEDGVMGGSLAWVLLSDYSELLLNSGDEDRRTACSARNGIDGRGALVARWPNLTRKRTRAVGMPSSDGHETCVGVLVQGFPFFMAAAGLQRSFSQSGIWCRWHGARQRSAREVLASWVRLRKKMAEWRHGVVRSKHWRWWGSTV
jgi:hypothetical protein